MIIFIYDYIVSDLFMQSDKYIQLLNKSKAYVKYVTVAL